MTTDTIATTAPEELEKWTGQVKGYLETNNRQRITPEMKKDLLALGAKYCYRCSRVLSLESYTRATNTGDGYRAYCRSCESAGARRRKQKDPERWGEYARRYYEENKDKIRERSRMYQEANREHRLKYQAEYREENREKIREKGRQWYWENRDRQLKYLAQWRAENPDYQRQWRADRPWYASLLSGFHRAVEAGLPADEITESQLLESWEGQGIDPARCYYTGVPLTDENRSLDHGKPLSKPGSLGHVLENLYPCDLGANNSKGNKTTEEYLAVLASEL